MGDQGQFRGDDGGPIGQVLENPFQKTNKIQTETGVDWISELPDSVIAQILSLIPITDAYKTSILSKRWQYLWTSIDNVVFGRILKVNEFISFTDTVPSHLSCSKIKMFNLFFNLRDYRYSELMPCYSRVDKWVEFVVNKKVEDLELDVWFGDQLEYCLPQVLLTSPSIRKLICSNTRMPEEFVLNWISLKSLTLQSSYVGDEQIEKILLGCPQLESLTLFEFSGFTRLHITSPKCRSLELVDHWYPDRLMKFLGVNWPLEIVAPYVQHLKILELLDGVEIKFGDLSSLVHADLNFRSYNCLKRLDDVTANTTVINNFLASMRGANELTLPFWLTEVLSLLIFEKEYTSSPLLECKRLTINSWCTEFSLLAVASLLRSAPYLENLRILHETEYIGINLINYHKVHWDEDIDLSTKNFISLQNNILKGSSQNLKKVEVDAEFCGFHSAEGARQLPWFLKSLLAHATSLEKLVIASYHWESNGGCSTRFPRLIRRLLALSRAPNTAIVSYVESLEE